MCSQVSSTFSSCFQSAKAAAQRYSRPFAELAADGVDLRSAEAAAQRYSRPFAELATDGVDLRSAEAAARRYWLPFAELITDATGLLQGVVDGGSESSASRAHADSTALVVAGSLGVGLASLGGSGCAGLALSGIAVPAKAFFVVVAFAMANAIKPVLEKIPVERRFRTMQRRCFVALLASSVVYMGLSLPAACVPVLEGLHRQELVLHSACDAVASPLFVFNLSSLAQQRPEQAYPAIAWALASVIASAIAAADPLAGVSERLNMLGLSFGVAAFAGTKARDIAGRALSHENRKRGYLVCDALATSWLISPVLQGVALFLLPAHGLVPIAMADVIFKRVISHLMVHSLRRQDQAGEAGGCWRLACRALAIEYFPGAPPSGRAL